MTAPEVSTFSSLRLFRRDPRIRYAGRVHEDVAEALLAIGSAHWPDSGVTLFDGGYVDAADRRRKRERNLALLRASHAEAPDGLYVAYKLAITLPDDAVDERRAVLDDALRRLHGLDAAALAGLPFMPRLVALAVDDRLSQGRLMDAVEIVRGLHAKAPRALAFAQGVALARAGLADEARACLEGFALDAGDARFQPSRRRTRPPTLPKRAAGSPGSRGCKTRTTRAARLAPPGRGVRRRRGISSISPAKASNCNSRSATWKVPPVHSIGWPRWSSGTPPGCGG